MAAPRRRKIGHRRRVEDEGEDEGGPGALDLDDDSLTDESVATDDHDGADDSDTSNIDEASPTSANVKKSANASAKHPSKRVAEAQAKGASDTDMMLHGLTISDTPASVQDINFDDIASTSAKSPSAPVIVSSSVRKPAEVDDRRRQEHDEYKKKRDEDPAFVPNRGSFFMHDHRHAGPAANGFRPFGRGRGGGRGGRGGIGGPFAPMNQFQQRLNDPTTNSQWTHDMHEIVAEPVSRRPRQITNDEGPPNGNGFIPTREPNPTPINRVFSTEKHIGNAQVRVYLPNMKVPIVKSGVALKQYTKLPDHRPPLRRDKPVRISLPNRPPRYIYPAIDRSFIFIPRAMRPNHQRARGKPRSGLGSIGGFSRRTSVFGGSYYGSMYSPSIAMSRRSSFGQDQMSMFSPAGSVISRAAVPVDNPRPVVRLPPVARPDMPPPPVPMDPGAQFVRSGLPDASIVDLPAPQTHPLPQKPAFQENLPTSLPMHQPRPQKNISVADIESPAMGQVPPPPQSLQQPFHQQVPVQVSNGYPKEMHTRQPSYPSQHSTGTPLSQIPERAIHAAPFQPNTYGQPPAQQPFYGQQPYNAQPQQGYYYPQGYPNPGMPPPAPTHGYVPSQQSGPVPFVPPTQHDHMTGQGPPANPNLVAQEANGMVYYYDASQLPPMNAYPPYSAPQGYQSNVMGMGGMVTPSPDGFYYPQAAPGMVMYPQ